jgi:hypothetical protein
MNRFSNALAIQGGACNPIAISRALVEAINQARAEDPDHDAIMADPAVRLICHQLGFLMKTWQIEQDLGEYQRLVHYCEDHRAK